VAKTKVAAITARIAAPRRSAFDMKVSFRGS
jgi:hypothetical protein